MEKTLENFFKAPTRWHYLMDISRSIGIAHTSVAKNIGILLRQGLILKSIEKRGSRKFPLYKANAESSGFRKQKILYNLSAIIDSGLIEHIEEKLSPRCIVLFGSYRRGEDTEESDIDLFVECKQEEIDLSPMEKKLDRKIQLHFNENFPTYPKELRNNVINGIVLSGFLECYK
jgi:predicted nucleotidyltransferase